MLTEEKSQNQISLFPLDKVERSIIKQGKSAGSCELL